MHCKIAFYDIFFFFKFDKHTQVLAAFQYYFERVWYYQYFNYRANSEGQQG